MYEAIIFFDGPLSKWRRGGRVALGGAPSAVFPEPDPQEVIARKAFRWRWMAEGWARGRLNGFENLQVEIRRK